ncbi:hypothetical protein K402DRAFT_113781 [Aulographum hederae CBS 113979]|uniref:RING-type domain-containing protein n=1 Tax=Aulographum hederae CBS 113979 TaxID=1176131 RepID=A0A6G1GX09_9PEZI|nr:hypothetical protein K402DRAFT_113781 [Aulographum hederae CBS 113979]
MLPISGAPAQKRPGKPNKRQHRQRADSKSPTDPVVVVRDFGVAPSRITLPVPRRSSLPLRSSIANPARPLPTATTITTPHDDDDNNNEDQTGNRPPNPHRCIFPHKRKAPQPDRSSIASSAMPPPTDNTITAPDGDGRQTETGTPSSHRCTICIFPRKRKAQKPDRSGTQESPESSAPRSSQCPKRVAFTPSIQSLDAPALPPDPYRDCPICFQALSTWHKRRHRLVSCKNCDTTYHRACLGQWMPFKTACPYCTVEFDWGFVIMLKSNDMVDGKKWREGWKGVAHGVGRRALWLVSLGLLGRRREERYLDY